MKQKYRPKGEPVAMGRFIKQTSNYGSTQQAINKIDLVYLTFIKRKLY
jgi:hypothetical protein